MLEPAPLPRRSRWKGQADSYCKPNTVCGSVREKVRPKCTKGRKRVEILYIICPISLIFESTPTPGNHSELRSRLCSCLIWEK